MEVLALVKSNSLKINNKILFKYPTLTIHTGFLYFIVGKSGTGKSLFLEFLYELFRSESLNIAYMPQYYQNIFIDTISVKDLYKDLEEKRKKKFKKLLELLNLNPLELNSKKSVELSTGMKQRIFLALTLSIEADIFLLDEPFSSIDNYSSPKLFNYIKDLSKNYSKTFFIIMHELEYLLYFKTEKNIKILYINSIPKKLEIFSVEEFINKSQLGKCLNFYLE